MSIIYAMSDIHGCYVAMKQALDHIQLKTADQLLFVGDYVDGGNESLQVLNEIMALEQAHPNQVITLLGNHDEWFCNWLFPKNTETFEPSFVDFKTVKSFLSAAELEEIKDASRAQVNSSEPISVDELIRLEVVEAVRHQELFKWLKQKMTEQRYYERSNQIYVHAGIDEEAGEYWKQGTMDDIFTGKFPATTGKFYKDIISGHIHSEEVANDNAYLGKVYWDHDNHFFIDGHSVTSGIVPILKYDTENEHYSSFEMMNGVWTKYRLK
ncbi:metallophosphoesterase [Levilactobacillus hammesii]|nr:metallophosphoesterase [Levilactobacillus hammesii]